ncbi:MAG: hypothetical protein EOP88_17610 [Verrucomicrobiaceae bacterium]|nr:MAG: hypothetical protein EOP88_17610 [Verrucomicrobiaceae bacterium]
MKSPYILPVFTAIAGFAVAWVAKPAAPPATVVGKTEESAPGKNPGRSGPAVRPSQDDSRKPKEVKASDFPLADQADQGPKTRDEARMIRLSEALGLTIDQQGSIISLIEDVQSKADPKEVSVIKELSTRGKMIEEALAKLLTPEQLAKFEELRVRERENRVEGRAQRLFALAIDDIDMSPEQREQVLERLRQKAKADMQTIPAAATLLLDKSMLPTNNKELSVDGVLLLAQVNEEVTTMDVGDAHQMVLNRQRQDLEDILKCYDGILTAGQMGQYQAALLEQRQILNRLPKNPTPPAGSENASQADQVPPPGAGEAQQFPRLRPEEAAEPDPPPLIVREPYTDTEEDGDVTTPDDDE